jgi:hypothetical protein
VTVVLAVLALVLFIFLIGAIDDVAARRQQAQWDADRIEDLEANLRELLRLYDWRFELAKEEEMYKSVPPSPLPSALRAKLRQYGEEKKAAWAVTRELITGCSASTSMAEEIHARRNRRRERMAQQDSKEAA